MTIAQIKQQLGVAGFNFGICKDKDGNVTDFLRHWDAKGRFSFVAHKDVIAKAKAEPNGDKFAIKWQARETQETKDANGNVTNADTAGLAYDSYILIWSDSIVDSL